MTFSILLPIPKTCPPERDQAPHRIRSHPTSFTEGWDPPITVWPLPADSGINFSDPLAAASLYALPGWDSSKVMRNPAARAARLTLSNAGRSFSEWKFSCYDPQS